MSYHNRNVPAFSDITARKDLEAQLETSRMQVVSSARLSALGMMAGGLAHEINNPLGIIHAYASNLLEMAQDGQISIPVLESTSAHIKETAERIGSIVKSLRHIAREGDADPILPASIRDLIERVLELSREPFRMHSIELICAPIDPQLQVPCREVQIAQVVMNLLQNAFDAVEECTGEKWVAVEVSTQSESVVVSVTDSGPGVPPPIRTRIMEPFFTTKPVRKGTGRRAIYFLTSQPLPQDPHCPCHVAAWPFIVGRTWRSLSWNDLASRRCRV